MSATVGAYVMRDMSDAVLYVGSSGDVATRVRNHQKREWWGNVARVEVHPTGTRGEAFALEASLIQSLEPTHNIVRPRTSGTKRPRLDPPQAALGSVRASLGLDWVTVATRTRDHLGRPFTVEDLNAIECGDRVPTADEVGAIERAVGLPVGSLVTSMEAAA